MLYLWSLVLESRIAERFWCRYVQVYSYANLFSTCVNVVLCFAFRKVPLASGSLPGSLMTIMTLGSVTVSHAVQQLCLILCLAPNVCPAIIPNCSKMTPDLCSCLGIILGCHQLASPLQQNLHAQFGYAIPVLPRCHRCVSKDQSLGRRALGSPVEAGGTQRRAARWRVMTNPRTSTKLAPAELVDTGGRMTKERGYTKYTK